MKGETKRSKPTPPKQMTLPLPGLPPPLPPGITSSQLSKEGAARLKAQRAAAMALRFVQDVCDKEQKP